MRSLALVVAFLFAAGCTDRTGGDRVPEGAGGVAGGGGSGSGGSGAAPLLDYPLPSSLDVGGDASGVALGDVDGDGYRDLALLVAIGAEQRARLLVVFGDAQGALGQRYEHDLEGDFTKNARGSASGVVAIGDLDADGRADVATASGVALHQGARVFSWQSFPDESESAFQPAVIASIGSVSVVRGTSSGLIERCEPTGACQPLAGQAPPCAPGVGCTIEDLVIGDFDGDSKPDVLAGAESGAALWTSIDGWQTRAPIPALPTADLEAGDVDQDGVDDVVAQRPAASESELWIGTPGGTSALFRVQTIAHHAPGNEASALADASFDNCLDLVRVAFESPAIAVRLGSFNGDSCLDQLSPTWVAAPGVAAASGIQQADVNGDGIPEWIVRTPLGLHFIEIPILDSLAGG